VENDTFLSVIVLGLDTVHSVRSNQPPSICAILKVGCAGFTSKFFLLSNKMKRYYHGDLKKNFICTYSKLLHLMPSDSSVSEDAGIEPTTVKTLALAIKRSNHCATL
jgi:hypothetical protein